MPCSLAVVNRPQMNEHRIRSRIWRTFMRLSCISILRFLFLIWSVGSIGRLVDGAVVVFVVVMIFSIRFPIYCCQQPKRNCLRDRCESRTRHTNADIYITTRFVGCERVYVCMVDVVLMMMMTLLCPDFQKPKLCRKAVNHINRLSQNIIITRVIHANMP